MSGEAEPEQANEELVKQDSNMWEFEGAPEGEDAESPATNGKAEDKDGDMTMGEAAQNNAGGKHAPIPTPAKAGEVAKSGTPAQGQPVKQPGPKFGSGVNQGKAFEGRRQHRYFVLKSKSMFNVDQSVEKGIWATQKHNEEKLNEAFAQKCGVYLIFSVNMSGHFQGYARMMSYVSRQQTSGVWEGGASVGGTFKVDWKRRVDLPFESTHQMFNPLNEGKPVRICRDGQEVPHELGARLTRMMDELAQEHGIPPPRPAANAMQPAGFGGPAGPPGGPGRGFGRGFRGRGGHGGPGMRPPPQMDMHGGMPMDPMGMPIMMMGGPMGGGFGPMGMRPPMDMMGGFGGFGGFEGDFGGMQGSMNGGMNGGFGGGGFGRRPRPPIEEPEMPMGPRRVMPGYTAGREGLGGGLTVRARAGRPEEDYEGDDWEGGYGRGEYGRRRGRRESPPHSRSRRHRSRSESPVRRTSRRRRSRSRSRSRSRNRGAADMGDLTYEQYLEAFEKMRRAGGSSAGAATAAGNPAMGGMNPMMMGMMGQGVGGMSRGGAGGMPNGMAGADGSYISEDQYLRVWEQYSKMTGMPFDAQTVRGWYQQHRAAQAR
ncbi:g3341 [Coccomyxa viridis]|uniref:G3341 protein n=1 Tax=Coccomyxa viridis TaxID=1274662 RepID=A0ABP1FMJ7_9CHLO